MPDEKRFDLITGGGFKEKFADAVRNYFTLIPYSKSEELFKQQTEIQEIKNSSAEFYYEAVRKQAWKLAKEEGKYPEAINMVRENLDHLKDQGFDDHDTKAITIFFLRRLGKIYEHQATYGQKEKSFDDPDRQANFFSAAYDYMLGDIELGIMTEYSGRISESLRGAGFHDAASQFDTAFWGKVAHIGDKGMEELRNRRRGNVSVAQQTGGVKMEEWLDELPDTLGDIPSGHP